MFVERQDAFKEEKVAGHKCDFSDSRLSRFFLPAATCCLPYFSTPFKVQILPFFAFSIFHFVYSLGIFWIHGKILQDFGSIKCIIWKDFSSFKALRQLKFLQNFDFRIFMTFNSRELSSRAKIFVAFLKFSFQDIFFNVPKINFIIGVNQKWLEDLERFLHFIAKGRASSKDRTLQDFKGGVATLLLLILIL